VTPVICRFNCSGVPITPGGKPDIPKVTVLWSDPKTWPSGKVPDGSEATLVIPGNLSVTLDVSPPLLKQLIVDGEINF
jgi:cell surface hyaluronidase